MSWKYLNAATLATKANVLAGPILRKVTPDSVTVWFALQKKATVTLTVMDAAGVRLFDSVAASGPGTGDTIAVGANLHIVAVTAKRKTGEPQLVDGVNYTYDATFVYAPPPAGQPATAPQSSIAAATTGSTGTVPKLTYTGFTRPSFCLPAKNINNLRILHGSCRKAAGDGLDALAIVDTLIEEKANLPVERPQQLLLTGDQIYADDVAPSLLVMLTDAATCLLGWDELLPTAPPKRTPASQLPPYSRRPILAAAKFTSEDLDSHLMSVGEYLCMYLFAWSDTLWPPLTSSPSTVEVKALSQPFIEAQAPRALPSPAEMLASNWAGPRMYDEQQARLLAKGRADAVAKADAHIHNDILRLNTFRATLPNVRRALANISTYMIFDDHEIADDWNMTEFTAFHLYATEIGRRVVQNGLVAYALCQHWGNVPEQFLRTNASLPGTKLLALLDSTAHTEAEYSNNSFAIADLLNVPIGGYVESRLRVDHSANGFVYNYTIEGPAHQVLVTDTRTWRTYPRVGGEQPDLLPPTQFAAQIVNTPALDGRMLMVVLSTNAPPVRSIRGATEMHVIANRLAHFPDIHEAWELPSVAFDRLIKALSDKVGFTTGQTGKVVLLSGDVHIGFASRLHYKATTRFEETKVPAQHANVVVAQLVASSFKKQTDDTIGLQREGYHYAPATGLHWTIFGHKTEYYVGWNVRPSGQAMGTWADTQLMLNTASTVQLLPGEAAPHLLVQPPDFSYQLDYLTMTNGGVPKGLTTLPPPRPPNTDGAPTKDELEEAAHLHLLASDNYRQFNSDPAFIKQIIGVNNMGDLTFPAFLAPGGGPFTVNHRLRFRDSAGKQLFVDYAVNMEAADPGHPSDPRREYIQVTP